MAAPTIRIPDGLAALLPGGGAGPVAQTAADAIPRVPGAYLVVVRLDRPLDLVRPTPARLSAGWYLYAGSARGPGGLRARLGRHLGKEKRPRWHIDQVTAAAAGLAGLAYVGETECGLIGRLCAGGSFTVPVAGFGSSDCRTCPSHFLRWAASGSERPRIAGA